MDEIIAAVEGELQAATIAQGDEIEEEPEVEEIDTAVIIDSIEKLIEE